MQAMTAPWYHVEIDLDHRSDCGWASSFPQAGLLVVRDTDRFPEAEILLCPDCGARVILRDRQVVPDPDREALELDWKRDELEAEMRRVQADAMQQARLEWLRRQVRDLESRQPPRTAGAKAPRGRPPLDHMINEKLYHDAAAKIRLSIDKTPTYETIAEELGISASTVKRRVKKLGLASPGNAGLPLESPTKER
jgi:hypothetical protein